MKKVLFFCTLAATFLFKPPVFGLWWLVDEYLHGDERKATREAFVNQIIENTFPPEKLEKFKLIDEHIGYGGQSVYKEYIPANETEQNYTEHVLVSLYQVNPGYKSYYQNYFERKSDLKFWTMDHMYGHLKKRNKKLDLDNFYYEDVILTANESLAYGEGYPLKEPGDENTMCIFTRSVRNGNWEIFLDYVCEKSRLNEHDKEVWLSNLKDNETINYWIERSQSQLTKGKS